MGVLEVRLAVNIHFVLDFAQLAELRCDSMWSEKGLNENIFAIVLPSGIPSSTAQQFSSIMNRTVVLKLWVVPLLVVLAACTTAFEIGSHLGTTTPYRAYSSDIPAPQTPPSGCKLVFSNMVARFVLIETRRSPKCLIFSG